MKTRFRFLFRRLIPACLAGATLSLSANEDPAADRAAVLIGEVVERISSAETFSTDIVYRVDVRMMGMEQELESLYSFAFEKPNKLSSVLREGTMGQTIVSDGSRLFVHLPMFDVYTASDAPEDLDGLLGDVSVMGGEVMMVMRPLMTGGVNGVTLDSIADLAYVGMEERDGENLHRLEVRLRPDDIEERLGEQMREGMSEAERALFDGSNVAVTLDVWVSEGERPVLVEVRSDLTEMMRTMSGEVEGMPDFGEMEMEMAFVFRDWKIDVPHSDETFVFNPPPGAEEVDDLLAAVQEKAGGGQGPQPLLGEVAPTFSLEMLGGGEMALADHLGEDIVILDFWATWCGPCIQAMPALIDVADEYRDRNVVFYAVNQREGDAAVEDFIRAREWDLQVPMDRRGSVADQYGVHGIPHTVIIGKDGKVQAVHVGFSPNLRETLSGELDTILAGDSLY